MSKYRPVHACTINQTYMKIRVNAKIKTAAMEGQLAISWHCLELVHTETYSTELVCICCQQRHKAASYSLHVVLNTLRLAELEYSR